MHGVSGLVMLEQIGNLIDYRWRFFSVDARPAPFFRIPPRWIC